MSEQCRSTVRIGPHQCGHRTGAVHSTERHWHAVLKHRLALLESYDSSTAVSAVPGHSVVLVTVLGHCQALPYDPVTAFLKDFYRIWKIPKQSSKHCLPVLLFTVLLSPESPHWTLVGATWSLLLTASKAPLAAVLLIKTRHMTGGWYFCLEPHSSVTSNSNIYQLLFEVEKEQTTSAKIFGVKQTVQIKRYVIILVLFISWSQPLDIICGQKLSIVHNWIFLKENYHGVTLWRLKVTLLPTPN